MKINKRQLQELVEKVIKENDFDIPDDWNEFDDFEFHGPAKDAAVKDIEDSGDSFEDIGKNKFEKGMNQKDFADNVSKANLDLPSDKAELADLARASKEKKDAMDQVGKFGMSLNEGKSIERSKYLAGLTKREE